MTTIIRPHMALLLVAMTISEMKVKPPALDASSGVLIRSQPLTFQPNTTFFDYISIDDNQFMT